MAATVIVTRLTSSGPTETDITSINTRATLSDAHSTNDTASPLVIPASGTNYSVWVVTRLKATVAPTTGINNLKWYTDGGNGFGTGVTAKMNTATSYIQNPTPSATTATQLTTGNYSTLAGAPTDMFGFTSGSPKTVSGSIGATTGAFGDRVVYQLEVGSTASPGATSTQETLTWVFDET